MKLGMVGLGRMRSSMGRRVLGAGHECVVFDIHPQAARDIAKACATATRSLAELVAKLETPRAIWIMAPAAVVDSTLDELAPVLAFDDVVIDGGALAQRVASRGEENLSNKVLSALRYQFGGHHEKS